MAPNILMICIDCLRNDFIQSQHTETPFLDNLAKKGKYYTEMFSTATTTTPCVASYMTGCYSETNGIESLRNAKLDSQIETIASKADNNGYSTKADITGPIIEATGLNKGFKEYKDHKDKDFSEWSEEVVKSLENTEKPVFQYIHIWDIHTPINTSKEFDKEEFGETKYARKLAELDRELQEFIDKLPDEYKIIILGDHGESISHNNTRARYRLRSLREYLRYNLGINTRPFERAINNIADLVFPTKYPDHFLENCHGENIFDFTSNIPFIISGSQIESSRINKQVRQVDIFPSILSLMNITSEEQEHIDGKNLLNPDLEHREVYIRACGETLKGESNWIEGIRSENWKYIHYPNRNWSSEVYNLAENPKELSTSSNKRKMLELKNKLEEAKENVRNTKK